MPDENKTWTVVGTSVQRGEKTLRLANGLAADRHKVLEKAGCTEIRLFDLPRPMRREEAVAWLEAQGDAVPVQAPRPPKAEKAPRSPKQERSTQRGVAALMREVGEIAHEELGKEAYRDGKLGFLAWEDISIETRQEISRNAAVRAGIKCPPGTYPELEAFLRKEGVKILEDGTLVG